MGAKQLLLASGNEPQRSGTNAGKRALNSLETGDSRGVREYWRLSHYASQPGTIIELRRLNPAYEGSR